MSCKILLCVEWYNLKFLKVTFKLDQGYCQMVIVLEIFEGYIHTIMISIIVRFLSHNSIQLLLSLSKMHMINQT